MLNSLIAELDKETQEAAVEEKNAQEEYEEFMTDCTTKRAEDSKTITDKEGAKAEAETELQTSKDAHKEKTGDLMALKKYIHDLHTDCDWLLENYDLRKEARASEIDALKKAKAVLPARTSPSSRPRMAPAERTWLVTTHRRITT